MRSWNAPWAIWVAAGSIGCAVLPSPGSGSTAAAQPTENFPVTFSGQRASSSPSAPATENAGEPSPRAPASSGSEPEQAGETPRSVVGAPQRTSFAVVIGIERYRDLDSAPGAAADARRVAALFKETLGIPEGNVRLAVDERATRTDIERLLGWLSSNVPAGGRAYLYFSGHGTPRESDGSAFIVPYDADTNAISSTAFALSDAITTLSRSAARDTIVLLDACFSGAGERSVLPPGARALTWRKETPPASKVALLASATGAQISGPSAEGGQGLFTKYLVEAVSTGRADVDDDGRLTLQELADWISPRVEREARQSGREQTPRLAAGDGIGNPRDIAFVWGIK